MPAKNKKYKCFHCDCSFGRKDILSTVKPIYCKTCVKKHYFKCKCGRLGLKKRSKKINNEFRCSYCVECHRQCSKCKKMFRNIKSYDDKHYCEKCFKKAVPKSYEEPVIQTPLTRKTPVFYKTDDDNNLFMGIELETSLTKRSQHVEIVGEKFLAYLESLGVGDRFFLKKDCSVTHGFEIVSQPHTLEAHEALGWHDILKWLRDNHFTSYNGNCGLHIHTNKDNLTTMQMGKLQYFFYQNKDIIRRFSKRKEFGYCKIETIPDIARLIVPFSEGRNAVNLCGTDTVEIRIFRGTLDFNMFMSALQFVDSLINFLKEYSIVQLHKSDSFKDYLLWLNTSSRHKILTNSLLGLLNIKRKGDKICV